MKCLEVPFTQSDFYKSYINQAGKEVLIIKETDGSQFAYIYLVKEKKRIFSVVLPFFYKLKSIRGPIFNEDKLALKVINQVDKLVKNPLCLRAQIDTDPLNPPPDNYIFNDLAYTYILDLQGQNTESYLASLDSKVRNIIRRSEKQGLTFFSADTQEDALIFFKVVNQSRKKNKLSPLTEEFFLKYWRFYQKSGFARFFLVFKEKIPLVAQTVFCSGDCFTLAAVSTSPDMMKHKLNATDYMQWLIIKMAIEKGVRFIDWGGAQPNSKNEKMNNIDRFKAKWGGKLVGYPVIRKGYKKND